MIWIGISIVTTAWAIMATICLWEERSAADADRQRLLDELQHTVINGNGTTNARKEETTGMGNAYRRTSR